jgi:hypothetical protein
MKIVQCNLTFKEFHDQGLFQPGVLVTTDDGTTLLVGHVNDSNGVCSCCREFRDDQIITSYAVVWRDQ